MKLLYFLNILFVVNSFKFNSLKNNNNFKLTALKNYNEKPLKNIHLIKIMKNKQNIYIK